jgi:hypothetical protein
MIIQKLTNGNLIIPVRATRAENPNYCVVQQTGVQLYLEESFIRVVQNDNIVGFIATSDVTDTQILPNAPVAFTGTTFDLLDLLATSFFILSTDLAGVQAEVDALQDLLNYKVYTALLTQSGDGTSTFTVGPLSVGKTYEITNYQTGDDFTNVANIISGTINTNGCIFIATGTSPLDWSNGTEVTDTSAPVSTILTNTLIGVPVWSYDSVGTYKLTLLGGFYGNVTLTVGNQFNADAYCISTTSTYTQDEINIFTSLLTNIGGGDDGVLENTYIEIRVYPII